MANVTLSARTPGQVTIKLVMCGDGQKEREVVLSHDTPILRVLELQPVIDSCSARALWRNRSLDPQETVGTYGIEDGDFVRIAMRLRNGVRLFVRYEGGESCTFEVDALEKIEDIKTRVAVKLGISAQDHSLFLGSLKLQDGWTLRMYEVHPGWQECTLEVRALEMDRKRKRF